MVRMLSLQAIWLAARDKALELRLWQINQRHDLKNQELKALGFG